MSGEEMRAHIQQLAVDLDVPVWVCFGCKNPEPWGQATQRWDDSMIVNLTHVPDTPHAYLIALHELGHVVDGFGGLRLPREAAAWRWAIAESRIPLGPEEWAIVLSSLRSYARDRRFKHTPDFTSLLEEAERKAA